MSGACTSTGDGCSRRPSDRPQSAHNTQPHGSAAMLGGTKASRSALAQACPAPAANTRDYLHSADGSEAHAGTRCINRISLIYSLSQINPPPAPRAGRTRAPAPREATFSPSRSSPRTEKPPLAPASAGEPQRMSIRPSLQPTGRGAEAGSPAQPNPRALRQLNPAFLFSAALPPFPAPAERETSPGRARLAASPPARHHETQPGQVAALELP